MLSQIYDYDCQYRKLEKRTSFFNQIKRQISKSLICSVCKEVFIEPVQIACGCRFCQRCISDECPECHLEFSKNSFLRDKAIEKEIFLLEIKCINDKCPHICQFRDLKKHLEICEYRREQCERCQESYLCHSRVEHLTKLCGKVIVKCDDCGLDMTREDMELKHRNLEFGLDVLCPNLKGHCPYKCSNDIHQSIKSHIKNCPNKPIPCPLTDLGCPVVVIPDEVSKHLQDGLGQHQIIMMNEIIRLKTENEKLQKSFVLFNEKTMEEIKSIKKINEDLINDIEKLKLKEKESIRNNENNQMDNNNQKRNDPNLVSGKDVLDVEDGSCTWTIRDIRKKYQDAKSGDQTPIISEPFYLSQPGYRMCLKVYPNGDGRGKDKFLSIFFVILKGDYDDLIPWPFKYRVNIILVSSKFPFQNRNVHMIPDNNEMCYRKPTSEFNVGAGQPEFIQLSELMDTEDYIHEGSLCIKLSIQNNILSYQNLRRNSSRI